MRARFAIIALIAALALGAPGTPAVGQIPQFSSQGLPSLAPLVRQVGPAVVNISSRGRVTARQQQDPDARRFFGRPGQREFRGAGSGFIIDAREGLVLTNAHVIEGAEEITVTLADGRPLKATRVGLDLETDVGLVRVPPERLTALPMGDSDKLEVGDYVLVHVGFAISTVDEAEAAQVFSYLKEMGDLAALEEPGT